MKAKFIELHGELVDAGAELNASTRACREWSAAPTSLSVTTAIKHLQRLQSAALIAASTAASMECYIRTMSRPKR